MRRHPFELGSSRRRLGFRRATRMLLSRFGYANSFGVRWHAAWLAEHWGTPIPSSESIRFESSFAGIGNLGWIDLHAMDVLVLSAIRG